MKKIIAMLVVVLAEVMVLAASPVTVERSVTVLRDRPLPADVHKLFPLQRRYWFTHRVMALPSLTVTESLDNWLSTSTVQLSFNLPLAANPNPKQSAYSVFVGGEPASISGAIVVAAAPDNRTSITVNWVPSAGEVVQVVYNGTDEIARFTDGTRVPPYIVSTASPEAPSAPTLDLSLCTYDGAIGLVFNKSFTPSGVFYGTGVECWQQGTLLELDRIDVYWQNSKEVFVFAVIPDEIRSGDLIRVRHQGGNSNFKFADNSTVPAFDVSGIVP